MRRFPHPRQACLVVSAVGLLSSGGVILASRLVPGPSHSPRIARRPGTATIARFRAVGEGPHRFDVAVGKSRAGERCLLIESRASACFTSREVRAGEALETLTRCSRTGGGVSAIAGFAPPGTVSALLSFADRPSIVSRVVQQTYAFAVALYANTVLRPRTITWKGPEARVWTSRYPIASTYDSGCNAR
jgi:hypothetical protein